jgi:hypothetical protein
MKKKILPVEDNDNNRYLAQFPFLDLFLRPGANGA